MPGSSARRTSLTPARAVTLLAAATYTVCVLVLTMLPRTPVGPGRTPLRSLLNVVPLVGADHLTFVLNIVMTVPLGLLLPLLLRVRSVAAVALVGLTASTAIEVTQGVGDVLVGLGRTVDVNDLIANTAGAVVGLLALRVLEGLVGPGLGRFALPGAAAAGAQASTRPPGAASTATTPAPSSAVPKT